jgi:hypothetical protein
MTSDTVCYHGPLVSLLTVEAKHSSSWEFVRAQAGAAYYQDEWARIIRAVPKETTMIWTASGVDVLYTVGLSDLRGPPYSVTAGAPVTDDVLQRMRSTVLPATGMAFDYEALWAGYVEIEGRDVVGGGTQVCIEGRLPFVSAATYNFTYSFTLDNAAPSAPWNTEPLQRGSHRDADTIVLGHDGSAVRTFMRHEDILLSASEIVFAAQGSRNPILTDFSTPFSSSDFYGDVHSLPEWIYITGASLSAKVDCYYNRYDIDELLHGGLNGSAWMPTADKPVCLLAFELIRAASASIDLEVEDRPGMTGNRMEYGIHLMTIKGSGVGRFDDGRAIILSLVVLAVLMKIPKTVVRFIALRCLGHLSTVYKKVAVQKFDIRKECSAIVTRLMSHSVIFATLADDADVDGAKTIISRHRMRERMRALLRHRLHEIEPGEIDMMSDYCYTQVVRRGGRSQKKSENRGSDLEKRKDWKATVAKHANKMVKVDKDKHNHEAINEADKMDIDSFALACAQDDPMHFDHIVTLFDHDRPVWPAEAFFMPNSLRRTMSGFRTQWKEKIKSGEMIEDASPTNVRDVSMYSDAEKSKADPTTSRQTTMSIEDEIESRKNAKDSFEEAHKEVVSLQADVGALKAHLKMSIAKCETLRGELEKEKKAKNEHVQGMISEIHELREDLKGAKNVALSLRSEVAEATTSAEISRRELQVMQTKLAQLEEQASRAPPSAPSSSQSTVGTATGVTMDRLLALEQKLESQIKEVESRCQNQMTLFSENTTHSAKEAARQIASETVWAHEHTLSARGS